MQSLPIDLYHNQNLQHTAKTHSKPPHSIAQTTTSQKPKPLGQIRKTPETRILFLPKDCHQRGCFGRVITITGPSPAPCHHRLMVALLEGREIGHGNWEGRERERVGFHSLILFNGVNEKSLSFCFFKYYFIVVGRLMMWYNLILLLENERLRFEELYMVEFSRNFRGS